MPGAHQRLQPRGEDVARDPEVALHVREAADAVEGLAHDQHRPALTEDLHRAADRARSAALQLVHRAATLAGPSHAERGQLARQSDGVVVGHQEPGARRARAAGRRAAGRAPPRRSRAGACGSSSAHSSSVGHLDQPVGVEQVAAARPSASGAPPCPRAGAVGVAAEVHRRVADEVARRRVAARRQPLARRGPEREPRAACETSAVEPRHGGGARGQRGARSAARRRAAGASRSASAPAGRA